MLILFVAILGTLMVSGFIQSNIVSDADVAIPIVDDYGIPVIEAVIVMAVFLVFYKFVLKKNSV